MILFNILTQIFILVFSHTFSKSFGSFCLELSGEISFGKFDFNKGKEFEKESQQMKEQPNGGHEAWGSCMAKKVKI